MDQKQTFTVSDTRRASGLPRTSSAVVAPRHTAPSGKPRVEHDAMGTGCPGWYEVPVIPVGRADCRMVGLAQAQNPRHTRHSTWVSSWTCRTGVHPFRPSFPDRLHSLLALLGVAYSMQRHAFQRHASCTSSAAPMDLLWFEFNMPWKELRAEIRMMLSEHLRALRAMEGITPHTPEHQAAISAAQRTSPETIMLALSMMSLFDTTQWGSSVASDGYNYATEGDASCCTSGSSSSSASFVASCGAGSADSLRTTPLTSLDHGTLDVSTKELSNDSMDIMLPPPRPSSIANCLSQVATQERQSAMAAYRLWVLQRALRRSQP